jgi:UDP-N-acetylmuramyl pentapeptide phosphotransferase/UDP-N-acetylglucosamine-1-phosphate transferase
LIDGLDGLAAGVASLAAVGFLFVAWRVDEPAVQ